MTLPFSPQGLRLTALTCKTAIEVELYHPLELLGENFWGVGLAVA